MDLYTLKYQKLPTIIIDDYSILKTNFNSLENVIIIVPDEEPLEVIPFKQLINSRLKLATDKGIFDWERDEVFQTTLPNGIGTKVSIIKEDSKRSQFDILTLAREVVDEHDGKELIVYCYSMIVFKYSEAIVAAIAAKDFEMPIFSSKTEKPKQKTETIKIIFENTCDLRYERTLAEARGNNIARYLTALPTNMLTPRVYSEFLSDLAWHYGWNISLLSQKNLKALGAGAFLSVAQGSANNDACIVRLTYTPPVTNLNRTLSLVGKGICFDTGGHDIKDAEGMRHMSGDMGGSASALGVLIAATEMKVGYTVDCWLALAVNNIGPDAYTQGSVITAANGKTIEVINTDAEGRLVLADTMHLASQKNPTLLISMATLTGSMVAALDETYSGAITNNEVLVQKIIGAGQQSGERVWPFPFDKDYDDHIDSDVADLKQCSEADNDNADHIVAARFLSNFLENGVDWIHLDLSSIEREDGLAHIPTFNTGFGVRFTMKFLEMLWR